MSSFWRAAGLTYVNYSSIAARVTRQALKPGAIKVNIDIILEILIVLVCILESGFLSQTVLQIITQAVFIHCFFCNIFSGCGHQERNHLCEVPEMGGRKTCRGEVLRSKSTAFSRHVVSAETCFNVLG